MDTFMTNFISGKCEAKDVKNWVKRWREEKNIDVPLREYLGMTFQEYTDWVKDNIGFLENYQKTNKLSHN